MFRARNIYILKFTVVNFLARWNYFGSSGKRVLLAARFSCLPFARGHPQEANLSIFVVGRPGLNQGLPVAGIKKITATH